jgi:hypothetical protein
MRKGRSPGAVFDALDMGVSRIEHRGMLRLSGLLALLLTAGILAGGAGAADPRPAAMVLVPGDLPKVFGT